MAGVLISPNDGPMFTGLVNLATRPSAIESIPVRRGRVQNKRSCDDTDSRDYYKDIGKKVQNERLCLLGVVFMFGVGLITIGAVFLTNPFCNFSVVPPCASREAGIIVMVVGCVLMLVSIAIGYRIKKPRSHPEDFHEFPCSERHYIRPTPQRQIHNNGNTIEITECAEISLDTPPPYNPGEPHLFLVPDRNIAITIPSSPSIEQPPAYKYVSGSPPNYEEATTDAELHAEPSNAEVLDYALRQSASRNRIQVITVVTSSSSRGRGDSLPL